MILPGAAALLAGYSLINKSPCPCAGPEKAPNGRELLGARILECNEGDFDATLWSVSTDGASDAAGRAIERVEVKQGRLTGRLASPGGEPPRIVAGEGLLDARLRARALCTECETFEDVVATITAVQPVADETRGEPGALERYTVKVTLPDEAKQITVCSDAIAIPGSFDKSGGYHHDESALTFACGRSAVAKCAQTWRYDPSTSENLSPLFAACTRMVRADYCSDAQSFTKNLTDVDVWDTMGQNHRSAPGSDSLAFEAAWIPEGPLCVSRPRYDSMRPGCFDALPRCDSEAAAEEIAGARGYGGHLLFNASALRP